MPLDTRWLPAATQAVFAHLRTEPLLRDFTLIGGTASNSSFAVLGIEGLFAAKASLLARRVRSRNLFDLHTLLTRHGYSIRQLFDVIRRIDPAANPDQHRDVLRGLMPRDADDEGFQGIGVTISSGELIAYFSAQIDAFEQEEALQIIAEVRGGA